MKRAASAASSRLGLVIGGGAGAAFAGETNGNGDPVPGAQKASSACAFSGQDLPDAIENNPPGRNDDAVHGWSRAELRAVGQRRRQGAVPVARRRLQRGKGAPE